MSICYVFMTDKSLPKSLPITCSVGGENKIVVFGENGLGSYNYHYYKEVPFFDDKVCVEDLRDCVPVHWYDFCIGGYDEECKTRKSWFDNEIIELEYQFSFIRELLRSGIDVWYLETWYNDEVKREDMIIREIDVTDLHFLDEDKRPDTFTFDLNVFYRFVMR